MSYLAQAFFMFGGIAAIPVLIALVRRNWGVAYGNFVIGFFIVYLAITQFAIWGAILLWILAFINAFRKRRITHYMPRSPNGWN